MILKIFFFWRIGLFLISYLGSFTIPKVSHNHTATFLDSWAQWDGGHYSQIAQRWYNESSDFAFFPAYPLSIKILSNFLNGDILLSGLIISNIAFYAFLLIFYNLIKEKFSRKIAYSSIITFLAFPTSFYAVALYSESLFLLLSVSVFWFLSKKKFWVASIFASLSSITRSLGIILGISLLYAYFANINFKLKKIDWRFLHLPPAFFGLAIYCFYLLVRFNDPFKFLTSQTFWQRSINDPISTIFTYLLPIATGQIHPLNDYFDLGLTLLFLAILILGVKKLSSSIWIFSILAILIPASTGTLTSMPRYLLSSLGAFIVLGYYLETRPKLRLTFWTISLFLQAVLTTFFVNGYWVA